VGGSGRRLRRDRVGEGAGRLTSGALRIGDIELVSLSDGECFLPPQFYVGIDVVAHGLVADDGRVHIPIGCYLLRTGDRLVLLDAGLGPVTTSWGTGGALPDRLRAVGVHPDDIDTVVCTHLHADHAGWLVADGQPFFANATVRFGSGEWDQFVTQADPDDRIRLALELLAERGRLAPIDGDLASIAPGVTARHTPGHTMGHLCLVLASGDARAVLLGDAVECPLQLEEPDFSVMSDVDPALAARTRESLWKELEGTTTLMGAAHFPDLQLGRVLAGQGKRWFTPA
jgi:glyoxylase-like metal-dependent hydrolase (beta-lactamase superfamily II)